MALLETLQDTFDGPTLDPQWTYAGTNVTHTVDGALNLITAAGQATGANGAVTSGDYTFTGSAAYARVYAEGAATGQRVRFDIDPTTATGEIISIQRSGTNLTFTLHDGTNSYIDTSITYDPVAHAWWRIRHAAGVMNFETSPDCFTWTRRAQASYTLETATYKLKLRTDWSATTTATTVTFDSVNTPPPVPLLETLQDNFDTPPLNPAKWAATTTGTAVAAAVSGGTLNLNVVGGTTGTHTATVSSVDNFGFANSYFLAKVTPYPSGNTSTPINGIKVVGVGNLEQFQMYKTGSNTLCTCRIYDAGNAQAFTGTFTYSAPTQAWWRIRHTAGTIYFETATTDAGPWTIQRQSNYTLTGTGYRGAFDLTYNGTPQTGTARYDYVNITPSLATPTPVSDTETLDPPSIGQTTTTNPDSTADVDACDNPSAAVNVTADPNPATDGETLDNPTAVRADLPSTPDPIIDGETCDNPTAVVATPSIPDPIIDTETLGPPTGPTPPPRPVSALQDGFDGITLDPTKWTTSSTGVITVAVNGGTLNFTSTASASGTHAGSISSIETFAINGSAIYAKVTPGTATSNPKTALRIYGVGTAEEFHISREASTNLYFRAYNASGAQVNNTFIPYSTSYVWWRLRFGSGQIYWETAFVDSGPWTVNKQVAYTPATTTYRVVLDMQWPTATAYATVSRFDDVNNPISASVFDPETLGPPDLQPAAEPFTALSDDFTTMNQWTPYGVGVAADVNSARLNLTTTSGLATPSGGVISKNVYNLVESSLAAQVTTTGSPGNQSTTLTVVNPSNTKEYFHISKSSTALWCRASDTNGTPLIAASITYVAASMAWWRIRHSGTTMYFDTSPDNVNWTNRQVLGYTPSMRAMKARLETTWTTTSTSTTVWFDNVNIDPSLRPTPIVDTEQHGNPTVAVTAVTPNPTPDPILDVEELGDPEAISAAADAHTPDSIEDPEEIIGPDSVIAVDDTNPDSLTDVETLEAPTVDYLGDTQPDPITDPETFGPPTPIRNNNTVTPDSQTDPETFGDILALNLPYPAYYPDSIIDIDVVPPPDSLIVRVLSNWEYGAGIYSDGPYSGAAPQPTPPDPDQTDNLTYGTGTYGYGVYYGTQPAPTPGAPEPQPLLSDPAGYGQPPLHILGIGPWSPTISWRGLPNYRISRGRYPARPALALPPATSKGFTLRLAEGSEARIDLAMRRGEAIVIDEMDTDLWWRRKDPRTKLLEVIGRFNCAHIELSTSDTGVNLSAQFEDYVTVLGARMVLKYLSPDTDPPTSMWGKDTPVTTILSFALPENTGLDLTEATGSPAYPLGKITQPYHLPPSTTIAELMNNLVSISPTAWEWWVETPADVNLPPKLRFAVGGRGADKGVTLHDVGSGPTPIAAWTRNSASDDYANSLYYTGVGTGTGKDAGGGVVEALDAEIAQFGQRDALYGSTTQGGVLAQIRAGAIRKLNKLADRKPTYTVTLAHGFWRGRNHIDVGDTVRLILRLGAELINTKYRVSEITVTIDDNGMEDVSLTLGTPRPSSDPRSSQSPISRMIRTLKNYEAPSGAAEILPPED